MSKCYTEREVKALIKRAYNMGLNYAYYCMLSTTESEMAKAEQFSLEKLLKNPDKKTTK
jgi:hypothetical protein